MNSYSSGAMRAQNPDPFGRPQREPGVEEMPDDDVRTGDTEADPDDPDVAGDDGSGEPS